MDWPAVGDEGGIVEVRTREEEAECRGEDEDVDESGYGGERVSCGGSERRGRGGDGIIDNV